MNPKLAPSYLTQPTRQLRHSCPTVGIRVVCFFRFLHSAITPATLAVILYHCVSLPGRKQTIAFLFHKVSGTCVKCSDFSLETLLIQLEIMESIPFPFPKGGFNVALCRAQQVERLGRRGAQTLISPQPVSCLIIHLMPRAAEMSLTYHFNFEICISYPQCFRIVKTHASGTHRDRK